MHLRATFSQENSETILSRLFGSTSLPNNDSQYAFREVVARTREALNHQLYYFGIAMIGRSSLSSSRHRIIPISLSNSSVVRPPMTLSLEFSPQLFCKCLTTTKKTV